MLQNILGSDIIIVQASLLEEIKDSLLEETRPWDYSPVVF